MKVIAVNFCGGRFRELTNPRKITLADGNLYYSIFLSRFNKDIGESYIVEED